MTGHLLSTVNPQAAQTEEFEVPPIGARVQYFARPGQGRGPHITFPADVMFADPKTGACVLWVLYGREDYREHPHVHRRSDQNPYHSWEYVPDGFEELSEELADVQLKLAQTQAQLAELSSAIFGGYKRPTNPDGTPKSVIDILAEFEKRVFAAAPKAKGK